MKDLTFDDLHLFARVATMGTLSAVARERDVPVSQVSRALARIEKACHARLIHRSTHGLALTAEGETFLDACQRLSGTWEELEGEFATQAGAPSGRVRVAVSSVFAGARQRLPKIRACVEYWAESFEPPRRAERSARSSATDLPIAKGKPRK